MTTDEGSVPLMRIWSILLIKSDQKWCIHLSRSLFTFYNNFKQPRTEYSHKIRPVSYLIHTRNMFEMYANYEFHMWNKVEHA